MNKILKQYQQRFQADSKLSAKARKVLPDGINSDSRYFLPHPIYANRADGAKKWSTSNHELIDFWMGHGALLFGHNPPEIVEAVQEQMQKGVHFGACHPLEIEWASLVQELIPSAELVRFTNSGTEANQQAIRLARAFSGKNKVMLFEGHYHGWLYPIYPTTSISSNSYNGLKDNRIICPPNDITAVEKHLKNDPDIACILLEPTGPCSGVVPLDNLYLKQLRALTKQYGVLLIFDEVITGFRVSKGGAQRHYNIHPDLTTLGKILTGGLPGGAIAGKEEILNLISFEDALRPLHQEKIPHYGTFAANPISAAAGIAMLKLLQKQAPYEHINQIAKALKQQLNQLFTHYKLDWVAYGEFSCIKFFIGHKDFTISANDFKATQWNYKHLLSRGNNKTSKLLRMSLLLNGIDISLSSVIAAAHTMQDVQQTVACFEKAILLMQQEDFLPREAKNRRMTIT